MIASKIYQNAWHLVYMDKTTVWDELTSNCIYTRTYMHLYIYIYIHTDTNYKVTHHIRVSIHNCRAVARQALLFSIASSHSHVVINFDACAFRVLLRSDCRPGLCYYLPDSKSLCHAEGPVSMGIFIWIMAQLAHIHVCYNNVIPLSAHTLPGIFAF